MVKLSFATSLIELYKVCLRKNEKGIVSMKNWFEEFEYVLKDEKICINGCLSAGTTVEIPEEIEGYPVVEIAPYAFAWNAKMDVAPIPKLAGDRLEEIILPKTIKKIGKYAFYNCKNLYRIEFFNTLMDLGAGAFTGCHKMKEIKVSFTGSKQSILREFLIELAEEQMLELCYEDGEAKLLFPEYFEESVENTPARILEIHTHGSGMLYRNCFIQKELDFRLYDEKFKWAVGQEFPKTLFQLALQRLLYPYHLTEKAEKIYITFLQENLEKCALWAAENERKKELYFLADNCVKTDKDLNILITAANKHNEIAILSYLMDKKHLKFKSKRKTFEL